MASFDTVPESRWSEAPVLAAEGYALHLTTAPGRLDRWVDGAERLAARDAFPADRNSFFYRPLELLGIALGANAAAKTNEKPKTWLVETVGTGASAIAADAWHLIPAAVAADAIGATLPLARPPTRTHAS